MIIALSKFLCGQQIVSTANILWTNTAFWDCFFVCFALYLDGQGLGKDGSGMVEPVQAQAMDSRAGLGNHPKKVDPSLEVHPGDSYRTLIQKKALARFQEMS